MGLHEKKYELKGVEGLNRKVKDLNLYITDLRKENEQLTSQVAEIKDLTRDYSTEKDKEV